MTAATGKRLAGIWVLLLALDVAIQVLMKLAGDDLHAVPFGAGWLATALVSPVVWISLVGYMLTFLLWLAILQRSSLSAAFPLTALVYVLVPICGWLLFRETFHPGQMAG